MIGSTVQAKTNGRRWIPLVAASLAAVMVLGQFTFLAGLPIFIVLAMTLWNRDLRRLSAFAIVLAAAYTVPLLIWMFREDPAPSLSKDIHPVLAALIVIAAIGYAAALHYVNRRKLPRDPHFAA